MAEMSREEVLARYRHLRAISTHHHTEAMNFVSRPALLGRARQLGLAAGGMLAAESLDELTLAFDLAIHAARPDHTRAVDRHAGAARPRPGPARTRPWSWRRCAGRASRSGGWSAGTRWSGWSSRICCGRTRLGWSTRQWSGARPRAWWRPCGCARPTPSP